MVPKRAMAGNLELYGFGGRFWTYFGTPFGPTLAPKAVPKASQKSTENDVETCCVFHCFLIPFRSLLGFIFDLVFHHFCITFSTINLGSIFKDFWCIRCCLDRRKPRKNTCFSWFWTWSAISEHLQKITDFCRFDVIFHAFRAQCSMFSRSRFWLRFGMDFLTDFAPK